MEENKVVSGEFSGKTNQEAIEEGLKALGITEEEAVIEVVEEAKKGFLGLGATKARVKITKIEAELPEKTDGERTVDFLTGLFEILGYDVTIGGMTEGEKIVIDLEAENTTTLIGKRGEILDSIQTLAGAVANIGRDEYKRVVVDCSNYRETREEKLQALAKKLADKAVALGKKMKLDPMNPYERRIIHSTLSENENVKTQSEGKEPNRFVVIIPNNLKTYPKKPYDRNGKKPYDKNRKPYPKKEGGERKPYDRNGKKPYDKSKSYGNAAGGNGERRPRKPYGQSSGGTGTGNYVKRDNFKKSNSSFFGTYLGNSRESGETKENKDE